MNKLRNAANKAVKAARNAGQKAAAVATGLAVSGSAFAATTPVDQVKAKIEQMGTDGILIATTLVVAVWGITAIFMLRRKG